MTDRIENVILYIRVSNVREWRRPESHHDDSWPAMTQGGFMNSRRQFLIGSGQVVAALAVASGALTRAARADAGATPTPALTVAVPWITQRFIGLRRVPSHPSKAGECRDYNAAP